MSPDCVHPARMLQNPRSCRWTRGPGTVVVADCAIARGGCGAIVVLNPEPVEHAGEDVTNADHGGGLGSGVGSEVNMNPNMEG